MKNSQPIRMCIACRSKQPQNTLVRFKHEGKLIVASNGFGRSFYLCQHCMENEKKVKGLIKRFGQEKAYFMALMTEMTTTSTYAMNRI
ncbi:MAG: Unknown protein [uncultured Sulfurovum sp.]|uniref:YlxR domain-containing protein n=1 Tax=uncultured Sulfurovum sp. TaxID=269237 RepID=A0A6S6TT19_9BACT|nr:MAG: Unknown protein [uncultured Sulfurovum sp.]